MKVLLSSHLLKKQEKARSVVANLRDSRCGKNAGGEGTWRDGPRSEWGAGVPDIVRNWQLTWWTGDGGVIGTIRQA